MTWVKKHWPWLTTLAAGAIVFLDPSVQSYAGAHGAAATAITTLWGVALAWAKSPRQQ
jgi:hypothetical protein